MYLRISSTSTDFLIAEITMLIMKLYFEFRKEIFIMSIAMTAMSLMIGCIEIVVCWKGFKLALKLVGKMFDEFGSWLENII